MSEKICDNKFTENELISVIVPVYNVEKYLDRCINSIVSQSYTKLEIILIDDGSTDNCPSICEKWAQSDCRVVVIKKANAGVFEARKTGINAAHGRYITFVDSDDFINVNMLQTLYELINSGDYDIAKCSYQLVYNDEIPPMNDSTVTRSYDFVNIIKNIPKDRLWSIWGQLYKRELLESVKCLQCKLTVGEDLYSNYNMWKNCSRMIVTEQKLYYYFRHDDSVMNSQLTSKKVMDNFGAYILIKDDMDKNSKAYPFFVAVMLYNAFGLLQRIIHDNSCFDCYNEIRKEILSQWRYIYRKESRGILTKNHRFGFVLLALCPKLFNFIVKRRKW